VGNVIRLRTGHSRCSSRHLAARMNPSSPSAVFIYRGQERPNSAIIPCRGHWRVRGSE
jgi:hypothetical protein